MHEVHIPVTVDAEREIDGEALVRATYFVITTDAPASVWQVDLPPLAGLYGLGALGVLGVVYSAVREHSPTLPKAVDEEFFVSAGDIAAIFALEEEGPLSVQLEDVWLPKSWCVGTEIWGEPGGTMEALERGDVLRVELGVFQQAYRYTASDITLDQFLETDASGRVFSSPHETQAIQQWAEDQIEETRRAFPDKKVKLRYRVE